MYEALPAGDLNNHSLEGAWEIITGRSFNSNPITLEGAYGTALTGTTPSEVLAVVESLIAKAA